jgi:hypothetical protein
MNSIELLAMLMPMELEETNVLYDRLRVLGVPDKLKNLLEQPLEAEVTECIRRILAKLSPQGEDPLLADPAVSRYSPPAIRPFSDIVSRFDKR